MISKKIIRKSGDIFKKGHITFIESHRGVNREKPQNSILAFQRAIELGIEAIELDVWLSSDDKVVVIHGGFEGQLEEFTNGKGLITKKTFEELRLLNIKNSNEKIPLLQEILILCKKNDTFINIEIKEIRTNIRIVEKVLELVEKEKMIDSIQISSFQHEHYKKVKEYNDTHNTNIEFGFLYPPSTMKEFEIYFGKKYNFNIPRNSINIFHKDITPELIEKAHKNNMAVMAWFDIEEKNEDENEILNLFSNKVDVICSNLPGNLKLIRCKIENGEKVI